MALSSESTSENLRFSLVLPCPNFVLRKWILRQDEMALTIKTQVLPMNPYVTRWDPSLPIPFLKTHVRLWGLSLHCYLHSWWQRIILLPILPRHHPTHQIHTFRVFSMIQPGWSMVGPDPSPVVEESSTLMTACSETAPGSTQGNRCDAMWGFF